MFINGIGSKGSVNQAGVSDDGRLSVESVSVSASDNSVMEGDTFKAYSGLVTITGAARQAILYIKNNDVGDIFLTKITIGTGSSAGGSDNAILAESVGNVVDSDPIVVSGTDGTAFNANAGSPRTFDGVIKIGATNAAVNGVAGNGAIGDFTQAQEFDLSSILQKGGSSAIEVTPPAGNTSMDITVALTFFVL